MNELLRREGLVIGDPRLNTASTVSASSGSTRLLSPFGKISPILPGMEFSCALHKIWDFYLRGEQISIGNISPFIVR